MILSQRSTYLSITALAETTLPSLTVITGVNGSGKTHLLRAIAEGHVTVDCAPDPKEDIRLFDWTTFVPNKSNYSTVQQLYQTRDQICSAIDNHRDQRLESLKTILRDLSLLDHFVRNPWEILNLDVDQLTRLSGDADKAARAHKQLRAVAMEITSNVRKQLRSQANAAAVLEEISRLRGDVATVDEQFFDSRPFGWARGDLFKQSFADLFLTYFKLKNNNDLRHMYVSKHKEVDKPPLTDQEFVGHYGDPPWDVVNQILADAGLEFEIDHPVGLELTRYRPELRKKINGQTVDFSSLSSGEQVLMCLAFCLYQSRDTRKEIRKPKILLFDEIDAPLHPSMSRILIKIIRDTLVRAQGVDTIFVTHSPSTVAVAPDESIYVLEPNTNNLHHETKRRAISTLTAEIPTLAISFEGRRQVFVESQRDAERYQSLFQIYAPSIESERSLVFIGVGGQERGGQDVGNGCDQVKRVVRELTEGGNISVLGLIDWDGKNRTLERIVVLSEGRRYAIENCLLDPLLLGATVFRQHSKYGREFGIPEDVPYAKLESLDRARLQELADVVQAEILELTLDEIGARPSFVSRYLNGGEIRILEEYAGMPGHELAGRAAKAFPCLKRFRRADDLLSHIIQQVMKDVPGLAPDDIFEVLVSLCEREIE